MITFYTNPKSRGQIAHWMLEEVGCDYEIKVLEYGPEMKSPEFLAINPMGKVPTIVHKEKVITESAAICTYLADAFPESGLAPAPDKRAEYYRWLFFAAGPLEAAVTNKTLGLEISDLEKQGMAGYGSFKRTIDCLEESLEGITYIGNETFSAADVYLGSQVYWGLQFGTIPKRPAFETYIEGLTKRPAFLHAQTFAQEFS